MKKLGQMKARRRTKERRRTKMNVKIKENYKTQRYETDGGEIKPKNEKIRDEPKKKEEETKQTKIINMKNKEYRK